MKSRWEIGLAWFAALTCLGWFFDIGLHLPQAVQWVHTTWRVMWFEGARGIGTWGVWFAIIKSLPRDFFIIPLAAAAIVSAVAWHVGPVGDDTGIKRGSTVTDAANLARIIKRRRK
ncbi:MAG: hypothetical protein ACYCVY_11285 [Acidiferrobacteraceae bacterium]